MDQELKTEKKPITSKGAKFWDEFKTKHPNATQFIVFFILSNGITLLQIVLMPVFRAVLAQTNLVSTNFQIWAISQDIDGSTYYIFDYAAGSISSGGGGGLAYFLAVQITLAIAQVINFFLQRRITFKANNNPWWAAMWYFIAYVTITIVAAALHGLYKVPIYTLFMDTLGLGNVGETIADFITMFIYAAISFWVFFPIFKIIFKNNDLKKEVE